MASVNTGLSESRNQYSVVDDGGEVIQIEASGGALPPVRARVVCRNPARLGATGAANEVALWHRAFPHVLQLDFTTLEPSWQPYFDAEHRQAGEVTTPALFARGIGRHGPRPEADRTEKLEPHRHKLSYRNKAALSSTWGRP